MKMKVKNRDIGFSQRKWRICIIIIIIILIFSFRSDRAEFHSPFDRIYYFRIWIDLALLSVIFSIL